MTDNQLLEQAMQARKKAYAPYSNYHVGAALLCKSGAIYNGCNIESAAYGATNCAERTAFFKAISDGEREFSAIAVVGGLWDKDVEFCSPCGICRQVMAEFCDMNTFRIIMLDNDGSIVSKTLEEILPLGFGKQNLGRR